MASSYDKGYRQAGRGETKGDLHCPARNSTRYLTRQTYLFGHSIPICEFLQLWSSPPFKNMSQDVVQLHAASRALLLCGAPRCTNSIHDPDGRAAGLEGPRPDFHIHWFSQNLEKFDGFGADDMGRLAALAALAAACTSTATQQAERSSAAERGRRGYLAFTNPGFVAPRAFSLALGHRPVCPFFRATHELSNAGLEVLPL
ncbi:hypothetical protein B0H65DRAFT_446518 [Neurospora tetraspora]|uniref:Uncharacterized protein n=1 Tax=Neurospora tetraspora TaxID=94610 RepID=A0AAE0J0P9_9PEZI|nr:hypothetical protein B0H65DRAFT_446518 [Neurospora tetraspora]